MQKQPINTRLNAAILAFTLATFAGASAIAADSYKLARSNELGIEIDAKGGEAWCRQRLSLTITAQNAAVYSTADFITLIRKLGQVLETECPEARQAHISGFTVRNELVYEGSAASSDKWVLVTQSEPQEPSPTAPPQQSVNEMLADLRTMATDVEAMSENLDALENDFDVDRWAQEEMQCFKLEDFIKQELKEPLDRTKLGPMPANMLRHLEDCHKVNHPYSSYVLGITRMIAAPISYIDYAEAADFFEHAARYGDLRSGHFAMLTRIKHDEAFNYEKIVANTLVLEKLDGKDYSSIREVAHTLHVLGIERYNLCERFRDLLQQARGMNALELARAMEEELVQACK